MTPEQFKLFVESNERVTAQAIDKYVNGKIDSMTRKLDAHVVSSNQHWEVSNKFMKELMPVRDGLLTIQNINKVVKWLGLPAFGAILAYWFVK